MRTTWPSSGAESRPRIVTASPSGSTPYPGRRSLTVSPETVRPSMTGGSGGLLFLSRIGRTVTRTLPVAVSPCSLTAW